MDSLVLEESGFEPEVINKIGDVGHGREGRGGSEDDGEASSEEPMDSNFTTDTMRTSRCSSQLGWSRGYVKLDRKIVEKLHS
jgi:hypothetical protein